MKIVTRKEWGARPPKSTAPMARSDGLHVHHTTGSNLGNENYPQWVRNIQNYHMDKKGWDDIGYSFLVDEYGNIYVGRGWGIAGAHTLGYNEESHGVAYLGNGSERIPRKVVWAYQDLVVRHDKRYGKGYVYGHRDRASTACPGNNLYDRLARIRKGPMYAIRWRIRRPGGRLGPAVKRRRAHKWFHNWLNRLKRGQVVGMKKVRRRV